MGMTRSRRRSFLQYVADNNPFYLCSAASMLLACLLLSNTTTWSPIAAHKLIALIVTLNLYEALLVALGLYLITRGKHLRDGVTLLVLEAVFLADIGFLNSELYTESLRTGLIVNAVLLVVGLAKLGLIFRVLRMPLRSPEFGLAAVTMVALLGHAALFRVLGDRHAGRLPDIVMYTAWWGLAALVVTYALVTRFAPASAFRGTRAGAGAGAQNGAIGHVFVSLMLASLAGHFGTSHWIYSCPFQAPDVSPALIGLAVLLAGMRANQFIRRTDVTALCVMLPLAAVFTSAAPSTQLSEALRPLLVSPLMLSITAAYLTYVYCFAPRYFVRYAALGVAAAATYTVAPTWATLQDWADRVYRVVANGFDRALPRTQAAWGGIALGGAFVMLAVGAAITLLRPKDENPPDDDQPSAPASPVGPIPVAVPVTAPLGDVSAARSVL